MTTTDMHELVNGDIIHQINTENRLVLAERPGAYLPYSTWSIMRSRSGDPWTCFLGRHFASYGEACDDFARRNSPYSKQLTLDEKIDLLVAYFQKEGKRPTKSHLGPSSGRTLGSFLECLRQGGINKLSDA